MQRMCRKYSPHQIGGKLSHECLKHCTSDNWEEWFGVLRVFQPIFLVLLFLSFFLLYLGCWGSFFSASPSGMQCWLLTKQLPELVVQGEECILYVCILSLAPRWLLEEITARTMPRGCTGEHLSACQTEDGCIPAFWRSLSVNRQTNKPPSNLSSPSENILTTLDERAKPDKALHVLFMNFCRRRFLDRLKECT